jgi:uncharacterized phage protein (TIGR01671 family)
MREILFRGKTEEGKWLEGYLHKIDGIGKGYTAYAIQVQDINTRMCRPHSHEVIPETVGQFTGLTDKNGKKIFEGDIVKFFDMIGEVCFTEGCFGIGRGGCIDWDKIEEQILPITGCSNDPHFLYNDNFISFWELLWNFNECDEQLSTCEVIGNIHDNKELLGE